MVVVLVVFFFLWRCVIFKLLGYCVGSVKDNMEI